MKKITESLYNFERNLQERPKYECIKKHKKIWANQKLCAPKDSIFLHLKQDIIKKYTVTKVLKANHIIFAKRAHL